MDIIDKLPEDLQNNIFHYLSHPCADTIRDRVKQLELDSIISIGGLHLDSEFDMRDLFLSEHFTKLKCDRRRRLWKYKFVSAEKIIQTLMNEETSEEYYISSSE